MASRLIAAIPFVILLNACANRHVVRLDTGQGVPFEHRPSTSTRPVKVDADAFEEALTQLMLSAPLPLLSSQRSWLAKASYPSDEIDRRQRLASKSFNGLCKPGQRRGGCLSFLDDMMSFSEWDKLGVGLALSLDPMKESISKAVESTLAPQLFYTVIATGLVGWAVLAVSPEPVFTKVAAIVSALLLIYLGVETFLELVEASRELKRTTDTATSLEELAQAGQRFGNRLGPEIARVFVLAVTVAVSYGMTGGATLLASRLPMLPRFPDAAAVGAARVGINLANVGQVSAVAIVGNAVLISLPATAVAMVAQGQGQGAVDVGGQLHHPISKRIARELERYPGLRGHYTERDPRFVTRAADKSSHNGYQKWHRDVEDEVIEWLRVQTNPTPEKFETFLRQLYKRPDMRARFPDGF